MYKPHPLYIPNIHVKTFGFFSVAISGSASEIRVCHKTENQSRPRKRIWGLVGLLSVRLGLVSIVLVIFFLYLRKLLAINTDTDETKIYLIHDLSTYPHMETVMYINN